MSRGPESPPFVPLDESIHDTPHPTAGHPEGEQDEIIYYLHPVIGPCASVDTLPQLGSTATAPEGDQWTDAHPATSNRCISRSSPDETKMYNLDEIWTAKTCTKKRICCVITTLICILCIVLIIGASVGLLASEVTPAVLNITFGVGRP